jgi:Spy/CpxP family protein refolding chaperone
MKKNTIYKALAALSFVFIFAIGATAFAGWGGGYHMRGDGNDGWGHGYHKGPGYHQGYGPHMGSGYGRGNMTEEEFQKFQNKRQEFFDSTRSLREQIYNKRSNLRNEMAKENPDREKLAGLQNELNQLEGQFEQKRLDHMLEMRKINPNAGQGYYGRGPGRGFHRGGGYGPGSCWR